MSHDHHGHHDEPAVNPVAVRGCLYLLVAAAFVIVFIGGAVAGLPALGIGIAVPVITVFGEPVFKDFPVEGFDITNTFLALLVTDALIIWIALTLRNPQRVPRGFQNAFEVMTQFLYNQTKTVVGAADAKKVFPLIATFFLLILVANWTKLIPGYETVGALHCAENSDLVTMSGYPIHGVDVDDEAPLDLPAIAFLKVEAPLDAGEKATLHGYESCEYKYLGEEEYKKYYDELEHEGHGEEADRLVITPFLRGASTDLNFTLSLAIIAMLAVQYFGIQKLGLGYFSKFVNLPAIGKVQEKPMGVMDFIVGLLEILSEFSKVISFTFRLFGVMFAGSILMIVVIFLTGLLVPVAVYGLELFVGIIQAYVFFILPLVLIKLAMISHSDH